MTNEEFKDIQNILSNILSELDRIIVGKEDAKKIFLISLLCEGHVLIEGLPGTAKTLLAKAFATAIGGVFKRIQFNIDTLPTDITGFYLYTTSGERKFIKGPIFANIVLADELNRAPARTQAALLEAMQEGYVTIEGKQHPLPKPFMVIACQLPYGYTGTYPLTEVLADRFMFRIWSGYNPREVEREVISKIDYIDSFPIRPITSLNIIMKAIEIVKQIKVSDIIVDYILDVIEYIRNHNGVILGPSTRASIALYKGARALAFLDGRNYVIPDDIKTLAHYALEHRIRVKPELELEGITPSVIIDRALNEVPVPK